MIKRAVEYDIFESVIKSNIQMTYKKVNDVREKVASFIEADKDNIDIPDSFVNKRTLLTGLLNQRPVKPVPEEVLREEDLLIKEENEERKIVDINETEGKIVLINNDITALKVEAIVNPCDEHMLGCFTPNHNCIDNNIHSNAGISLRLKCKEITKGQSIEVSKVILTDAFNLP